MSLSLFFQSLTRDTATEIAINVKALYNETESLLVGRVPLVRRRNDFYLFRFPSLPVTQSKLERKGIVSSYNSQVIIHH